MDYESCWLINFKDGTRLIFTETAYHEKHRPGRNVDYIDTEEHWFIMRDCINKNPDVEIIK